MKLSIVIPIYEGMLNGHAFLGRALDSLHSQTFQDFEIVITKEGRMAENTNAGIKKAKGEIIKILYQDDYLAHPHALAVIADRFTKGWLVTGCAHDPGTHTHLPTWNDEIYKGINTLGSPSVLAFENHDPLLFDESLTWLLDCDLYMRLHARYGLPTLLNDINVKIGIHEGQTTHLLADEIKQNEHNYLIQKYESPVRSSCL